MNKLFAFIFSIATFLSFPVLAFASGTFTASNIQYNATTHSISFDVSDFVGDPNAMTPLTQIGIVDTTHGWIDYNNTYSGDCSGYTHCTATLGLNDTGLTSFPEEDTYTLHLLRHVPGVVWEEFNSQNLSYSTLFPPSTSVKIVASPATQTVTAGTPFNVDVKVENNGVTTFNAARATVTVSSNLSITGINHPSSNACNFSYTKNPTTSDPSFAGAILGGSSTECTVYTMTLTPVSSGTGTITFTNASMKAYADSSEILTGVQNGSFTISDGPTPTPTVALSQLTVTSPLLTYLTNYTLTGTKDTAVTHVFVNGSETGVTFPGGTTWEVAKTLSLGDNTFTIYGSDGTNQTATQNVHVNRHTLGDINGDGVVDLIDASLFAVDWDKTENLTYMLSDMNGDGVVNLTDLSILAKLE